jgi:hypothetical protein
MSNPLWEIEVMKIGHGYCKVTLEPELELRASLWTAEKRRQVARKLQRWVRQLMISAAIMDRDAQPQPQPRLKVLPPAKLILN